MPLFYIGFSMMWSMMLVEFSYWWVAVVLGVVGVLFLFFRDFRLSGIGLILACLVTVFRLFFSFSIPSISFHFSLSSCLSNYLDSSIAYTLVGMISGDKSMLPYSVYSSFKGAGIVHLLSVSGFHTSLWSMMVYRVCLGAGLGRRWSSVVCAVFILFFVVVTGMSLSTVRAGVMFLVFFMGRAIGKSPSSLNSLGLSAVVVLVIWPLDTGFMLSFFSTLGILVAYPWWNSKVSSWVDRRDYSKEFGYRIRSFGRLVGLQTSVYVFTLPIVMLTVDKFSVAGIVSNMLTGWAASIAILLGGIGSVFSFVPFICRPLLLVAGLLIRYVLFVASIFSGWALSVGFPQFIVLVGIILLLKGLHILIK